MLATQLDLDQAALALYLIGVLESWALVGLGTPHGSLQAASWLTHHSQQRSVLRLKKKGRADPNNSPPTLALSTPQ